MKRRYPIAIASVFVLLLLLLVWAVFQDRPAQEVILMRYGVPLANVPGTIRPCRDTSNLLPTSTDANGKLDLGALPGGTEQIFVSLRDNSGSTQSNSVITLPRRGSVTIDMRGKRTISTCRTIHADFGFFQWSSQTVWDGTPGDAPETQTGQSPASGGASAPAQAQQP